MKLFFSIALFLAIVISQAQTTTLVSLKNVLPEAEYEQKVSILFKIVNELWAENSQELLVCGNMTCELSGQLNRPDKYANALIHIANTCDMIPLKLFYFLQKQDD